MNADGQRCSTVPGAVLAPAAAFGPRRAGVELTEDERGTRTVGSISVGGARAHCSVQRGDGLRHPVGWARLASCLLRV